MTFEEQLTQAFETLTERLRGEIDQHVRRALAELAAAAPYDRDPGVLAAARQELELAVSAARQASHAEGLAAGRDAGLAVGKDAGVAAGREEGLAAGREQGFAAGREEGLLAGREAGIAAGREEGFAAGREAGIAAGREEGFAAGREAGIVAGREEGLALGHDAGRTEGFREAADASALVDASPRRLAEAIRAIDGARSLTEVLDTLVSIASLDASGVDVWLVRSTQLHRWRPKGVTSDEASAVRSLDAGGPLADAARTNTIVRDEGTVAVPMALAGTVVAVFSANRDSRTGLAESPAIELMVRYAARSLEALTAFRTARALTRRPQPEAAVAPPPQLADSAVAEEERSARRYARLLVSEIKLYHEAAVVEGRRDRDLATRLGGEIARARVMYEQRVSPQVRARTEFFRDELVNTLADGDASLLELRT